MAYKHNKRLDVMIGSFAKGCLSTTGLCSS